jgi:protein-tyrosine-phosphatase
MKKLIIFVCNGNIERSVVAAECFRSILIENKISSKFLIDSYGIQGTKGTVLPKHNNLSKYAKEWKVVKPILEKLKINISDHRFKKITLRVVKKASVIIAMDKKVYSKNKNALLKQFSEQKNKIHVFSELILDHIDIQDPAGSDSNKLHKKVIENIYTTLENNYETVINWTKQRIF